MSGYAASARIQRGSPHLARATRDGMADQRPVALAATLIETDASAARDGDLAARVADSWAAARERWSQLTFFLLDPNSWR